MASSVAKHIQTVGMWIIVGLIVLAFVLVFGQPSDSGGPQDVAIVDGTRVGISEWRLVRRNLEIQQQNLAPGSTNDPTFSEILDEQAREELIQLYLLAGEAEKLGIVVDDREIAAELCDQIPPPCTAQDLEGLIESANFSSDRQYTEFVRRELLRRKLLRSLMLPIRVSDHSARASLERDQLQVRLRFGRARGPDFVSEISISDATAAEFAEAEPERVLTRYQARVTEYQKPERVKARHILLRGDDALEKAVQVRNRLESGESFEDVAAEASEDVATKDHGGDLGFFPRERLEKPLEEAAFSTEIGELVGPVESERGVHILRVEAREAAVNRSVDDVKLEIARDLLLDDRSGEAARAAAEKAATGIAGGQDFDEAVKAAGLELDETIFFRPSDSLIPGIGRVAGLREAAFALREESPTSPEVFGSQRIFYVISLLERREPDEVTIASGLEPARTRMEQEARARFVNNFLAERRQELEDAGRITRYPLRF